MIPLNGVAIQVSTYLEGQKCAVMVRDGVLSVSPAMHSLMKDATQQELEHLLKNIPVLDLRTADPNYEPPKDIEEHWQEIKQFLEKYQLDVQDF